MKHGAGILATGIAAAWLGGAMAQAATTDILVGLDSKITYGPDGQIYGPGGSDAVLVMDVSNPARPRIRASLPLTNSLLGPPVNLQITPDGKLGLVANSVVAAQEGGAWKAVPDNKLYVIDLTANPPKLVDTVTVGKQPSGLSIAPSGKLALIGNRAGKSVSVVSIDGASVKAVGEVPMGNEVSAVAIAPDGKRAFAAMNLANRVGVLAIDGQNVTYDKALDIPVAFNPYNVDVTPDGRYVFASCTGAGTNQGDAVATIEATGPHPHVVELVSPGNGPEGLAVAPGGKFVVMPLLLGTGNKYSDWSYTKSGEIALMSVGPGGRLSVVNELKIGALPEGVAFGGNGEYVYVGNYIDKNLQVLRIRGGRLVDTGTVLKLPGQPASMRAVAGTGRAR